MNDMTLVAHINMFDLLSTIFVYQNGNLVSSNKAAIDDISDTIAREAYNRGITKVTIVGPRHYCHMIKNEIEQIEMNTYGMNKLEVDLV